MDDQVKQRSKKDPLNVNQRLYHQLSELLTALDEDRSITTRERIAALTAIARIQVAFMALRKEAISDPDSGSAVRKYAGAFAKNASGRGKKRTGAAAGPEPDAFESADWDDDGDAA